MIGHMIVHLPIYLFLFPRKFFIIVLASTYMCMAKLFQDSSYANNTHIY